MGGGGPPYLSEDSRIMSTDVRWQKEVDVLANQTANQPFLCLFATFRFFVPYTILSG